MIRTVATKPFTDQRPGTSGLRKQVTVFQEPHYLENFIQSIFNSLEGFQGKALVLGGDGRFFNREAIQVVIKIAAANGFGRVVVGKGGILSTPAVSALIRASHAYGGIILSASHNPGGPHGDFGVKYNISAGGPAPETVTETIFSHSKTISSYKISDAPDVDIDRLGTTKVEATEIEIIDPVTQYLSLMKTLFDFDAIRALFASGFRMRYDALHAVTGPYAHAIFEGELKAGAGTVVDGTPLPDFGGHHPDPNPTYAKPLFDFMMSANAPDFGAASDGDGDRNMILGRGVLCDAVGFAGDPHRQRPLRPWLRQGRSPASRARCRPAPPPTASPPSSASSRTRLQRDGSSSATCSTRASRRYAARKASAPARTIFGRRTACGRSLFWLNILASRRISVADLVSEHWRTYGRNYYTRHDYEAIDLTAAHGLMDALRDATTTLPGKTFGSHKVEAADDFAYHDPVDGSDTPDQGIRVMFEGGSRIVYRLSGTGTVGATLRVYIEHYEEPTGKLDQDTQTALAPLIGLSRELAGIEKRTGRKAPTVIT